MPTLDDATKIPTLLGDDLTVDEIPAYNKLSRFDLVQVYDVSEQRVKTITVIELGEALGLAFS